MASSIDGLLSFLGDLYCTLIAFGVVRASKEAAWREKYDTLLKIAGPLVMAFGIWNISRSR